MILEMKLTKQFLRHFYKHPVINCFPIYVNKYNIDMEYIDAFLNSMEWDLDNSYYESKHYEITFMDRRVVGWCAYEFLQQRWQALSTKLFSRLKVLACCSESKFLRDIKSDIEERGRIYLLELIMR